MRVKLEADYVTEKEAAAIRAAYDGFETYSVDICNMLVTFHNFGISLPQNTVHEYLHDWEKSGLWLLPGTKQEPDL